MDVPEDVIEQEGNEPLGESKWKLNHLEATDRDKVQGMLISTTIVTKALYDIRPVEVLVQNWFDVTNEEPLY